MGENTLTAIGPVIADAARAFSEDPSYLVDMARQGSLARSRRDAKLAKRFAPAAA